MAYTTTLSRYLLLPLRPHTAGMQLPPECQSTPSAASLLIDAPLLRSRSWGLPLRRRVKYDPAVLFVGAIISLFYTVRKLRGEGLPWPESSACWYIYILSILVFAHSSLWALILPQQYGRFSARVAIGSGLLLVASILTDYIKDPRLKWLSYLVWFLICLPLFLPFTPRRKWLTGLLVMTRNGGEEHDQGPTAPLPTATANIESGHIELPLENQNN